VLFRSSPYGSSRLDRRFFNLEIEQEFCYNRAISPGRPTGIIFSTPMAARCPLRKEEFLNKSELLNWLQQENRQWQALLDQIGTTRMDQPGVNGDWSMKDLVAHMADWQPWLISRMQAAQRGEPEPLPPWSPHLQTDDEINAWIYERNRGRSVREVLDESHQVFQQLLAVIQDLPDDVVIEQEWRLVHLGDKRFPAGEFFDHFHDDHEPNVRAWLARVEK
jgi:hypothetical protein